MRLLEIVKPSLVEKSGSTGEQAVNRPDGK